MSFPHVGQILKPFIRMSDSLSTQYISILVLILSIMSLEGALIMLVAEIWMVGVRVNPYYYCIKHGAPSAISESRLRHVIRPATFPIVGCPSHSSPSRFFRELHDIFTLFSGQGIIYH